MFKRAHFKPFQICLILSLVLFALFVTSAPRVHAATITVNSAADNLTAGDGACTLREAIMNANSDSDTTSGDCTSGLGTDDIFFDSSLNGTAITLSITGRNENGNATGDLDITSNININGNGAQHTIIGANQIDRVFHIMGTNTVELNDLTVTSGFTNGNSTVDRGGGIRNDTGGILTIINSAISGNESTHHGGGIYTDNATTTIDRSTISNNEAIEGGGISSRNGSLTNLRNSTVSGNESSGQGGGIGVRGVSSSIVIDNSTITANIANSAGGGIRSEVNGTFQFKNSILLGNAAGNTGTEDCSDPSLGSSSGFNLTGTGTGCPTIVGDIFSLSPANEVNVALVDNGGNTDTHSLPTGSQAIDAGDPNDCDRIDGTDVTLDQRGVTRPQGGQCDIGSYELVDAIDDTGTGPGGVGTNDGTSSLVLWLRGDRGVFTDIGCSNSASNGNAVGCWTDQSGNSNDATEATNMPDYSASGGPNSMPTLTFNGTNDLLNLPNGTVPTGNTPYTVLGTVRSDVLDEDGILGSGNYGTSTEVNAFRIGSSPGYLRNYWWGSDIDTSPGAISANTNYVLSFDYDTSIGREIFINGISSATNGSTTRNGGAINNTVGRTCPTCNGGEFWDGFIPELIIYDTALTSVQRILVQNYLSAKYNVTVSDDWYDGDTVGNGDFDLDVAGIAQLSGEQNAVAHSAGIIVQNNSFLAADGDSILFGHRTLQNENTQVDLPTTGIWTSPPNPQRWARHWYFDVSGASGGDTVDIIFDFGEGSMDACCGPAGSPSNYRLLERSGASGQFSDMGIAATAIVGDQVLFQGVDATTLGSNYTLGTLNYADSPTAVTMQDFTVNSSTMPVLLFGSLLLLVLVSIGIIFRKREDAA